MKIKLISALLTLFCIISVIAVSVSAKKEVLFEDDFNTLKLSDMALYNNQYYYSYFGENTQYLNSNAHEGQFDIVDGAAKLASQQEGAAYYPYIINKDLATDMGITTGYQTVNDGNWTIETMIADSLTVTGDLNGDNVIDQNDRWGTVHQNEALAAFFASFGGYTVKADEEGTPKFVADTEQMIEYVQMAIDFNFMDKCQCTAEDFRQIDANNYFSIAKEVFTTGRGLYYIAPILTVVDASGLRTMKDEYGILPMPKYNDKQKDYINSFQYSNATVYSVPIQNTRDEFTGAVLEAMAYYSTDTLRDGYYNYVLGEKGSRDEESKQMLDLIFRTRINDLGFVYDWGGMITIYYYMAQNQISPVTMFTIKIDMINEQMENTLNEIKSKMAKE